MAAVLQKVKRGDRLNIPAGTFNAFIDAARGHRQRQHDATRDFQRDVRQTGIILVRNESGADRERFDVLAIGGPVIKPTDNPDAFKERVAVKGVTPSATHAGRFGVLLEPLAIGAMGRACVDGVCVARVEMDDEAHGFAEVAPGQMSKLKSASGGSVALLWIQPQGERADPQVAWCVVRLGLPSGGGAVSAVFAMITSKTGSTPPYRYTAAQATMDEDGVWTQSGGGATYNNVFNLEEQGSGGQWVNPLLTGDVVLIFAAPDDVDAFVCTRSHYRGTY